MRPEFGTQGRIWRPGEPPLESRKIPVVFSLTGPELVV